MKLFILTYGDWCGSTDEGYFLGAFSSLEKAEEAKETLDKYERELSTITEITLDELTNHRIV